MVLLTLRAFLLGNQKGPVRPMTTVGMGGKEGVPIIFRSPKKLLVKTQNCATL